MLLNEAHLAPYLALTLLDILAGRGRTEAVRIGKRRGNEGTLVGRELGSRLAKVLAGYSLYAIEARPRLNGVQIDFKNALFRPAELYEHGEIGLEAVAQPRATGP